MEYRHLGRSGLVISAIAYGNWITHGGQVAEEGARRCVRAALDAGITTFDTADMYANGRAEEVLGRQLKGLRRESLEILTKVYWPTGDGANDRGLARKHIIESVHNSLRRLQTDYVDLYMAHRYDFETPLEETMRAFDDLVRQGKVLYVGVSEWTADQISAALSLADEMGLDRIVSNQPEYSLLQRVIEADVLPLCVKEGIGQIVWSPLAQGILTGKYRPGETAPTGSRAASEDMRAESEICDLLTVDTLGRVQRFAALAAGAGYTPAAVALAWILSRQGISAAIIGASQPEQIVENARALDVQLEPTLIRAIDDVLGPVVNRDPRWTAAQSPSARP
jgi:voltage-dependent potassium channel beta subunit